MYIMFPYVHQTVHIGFQKCVAKPGLFVPDTYVRGGQCDIKRNICNASLNKEETEAGFVATLH